MKTLITIAIFIITTTLTFAQNQTVESYMETTNMGVKHGVAAGWVFTVDNYGYNPYKITLGAFYQYKALTIAAPEVRQQVEKVFTGIYLEGQVMNKKRIDLWVNTRVGVQNGENFLISPMVKAKYQVVKNFELIGGIGTRGFRNPTLAYGAAFNF